LKTAAKVSQPRLAIDGGDKAVQGLGSFPTKIGKDQLLEILSMWQLGPRTQQKLRKLIEDEPDVQGPHLFRYYNPGPSKVATAEEAMRRLIGVEHCLAVNSCTSALVASYRALGIGAGDEVIVPAYTFFAASATVASSNAIPVIEDVAQAAGGSFGGKSLGSIGTLGCFSFDYYKIVVSGEGGFVTTDDEWLYTRAQSWHDCAACWRPDRFAKERKEGELFCGENYRMSELEGAVALAQIRKTDEMLAGYRRAKKQIKDAIERLPGLSFRRLTDEAGDTGICLVMFLPTADQMRKAIEAMQAEGVPVGGIYDSKIRDWHVYNYWEHILDKKSVARDGLPWSAVPAAEMPNYSRDMCPRMLDLLSRAVMLDVNWNYSARDCSAIALGINKVLWTILK